MDAWAAALLLSLCLSSAFANMMDVIEKHKVPPTTCKNGCAKWSTKAATLWADGKVPADAGSYCAQPGAAVNDYTYGSWCYCAEVPGRVHVHVNRAFERHKIILLTCFFLCKCQSL